jgi:hypothetical protein
VSIFTKMNPDVFFERFLPLLGAHFGAYQLKQLRCINKAFHALVDNALDLKGCFVRGAMLTRSAARYAVTHGLRDSERFIWIVHIYAPRNTREDEILADTLDLANRETYCSIYNAFHDACRCGLLIALQWLNKQRQFTEIAVSYDIREGFRVACENNHLAVAQWMYATFGWIHERRYNNYYIESLFEDTCYKGSLQTAQWLYEMFASMTLIHDKRKTLQWCTSNPALVEWINIL